VKRNQDYLYYSGLVGPDVAHLSHHSKRSLDRVGLSCFYRATLCLRGISRRRVSVHLSVCNSMRDGVTLGEELMATDGVASDDVAEANVGRGSRRDAADVHVSRACWKRPRIDLSAKATDDDALAVNNTHLRTTRSSKTCRSPGKSVNSLESTVSTITGARCGARGTYHSVLSRYCRVAYVSYFGFRCLVHAVCCRVLQRKLRRTRRVPAPIVSAGQAPVVFDAALY